MAVNDKTRKNESGQSLVEYVMLLMVVVTAYLGIVQALTRFGLGAKLLKPLQEDYRRAYQYGHPKAKGYEDSTPENHPRIDEEGNNNFRIFINPGIK